jgi:hypothetical protein
MGREAMGAPPAHFVTESPRRFPPPWSTEDNGAYFKSIQARCFKMVTTDRAGRVEAVRLAGVAVAVTVSSIHRSVSPPGRIVPRSSRNRSKRIQAPLIGFRPIFLKPKQNCFQIRSLCLTPSPFA